MEPFATREEEFEMWPKHLVEELTPTPNGFKGILLTSDRVRSYVDIDEDAVNRHCILLVYGPSLAH